FYRNRQGLDTAFKPDFTFWPLAGIHSADIITREAIFHDPQLVSLQCFSNFSQKPIGFRFGEDVVKGGINQEHTIVRMVAINTSSERGITPGLSQHKYRIGTSR